MRKNWNPAANANWRCAEDWRCCKYPPEIGNAVQFSEEQFHATLIASGVSWLRRSSADTRSGG